MKRRNGIALLAAVLVAGSLWWLLRSPYPEPPVQVFTEPSAPATPDSAAPIASPPKTEEELHRKTVAMIEKLFDAPIAFYGRVVDQNGNPVPDAEVGYTAADAFNASGSQFTGKSDAAGYFRIAGIKGGGLLVGVGKEGYYPLEGKSSQNFGYGMGTDSTRRPPPTKESPAVFVLHKMGKTEPLVRVEQSARIPKNGTPATVNLMTGRLSPNSDFRIEAWTEAPVQGRKFSWRCRVTVPGGGLVEREGQFDFEAPEDGYKESVELGMPAGADQWTSQQEGDYFVKLPDGRFARIRFTMIAGGNHYFLLEAFLNPKPGSRNLEFDPAKVVKSP